ncbi:MAG TPA: hypothetical protein VH353_16640 [Caulobacteraceae bacterium]|nr:hypothetical protein [Caulobacteraceae bacterium]
MEGRLRATAGPRPAVVLPRVKARGRAARRLAVVAHPKVPADDPAVVPLKALWGDRLRLAPAAALGLAERPADGRPADGHQGERTARARAGRQASTRSAGVRSAIRRAMAIAAGLSG